MDKSVIRFLVMLLDPAAGKTRRIKLLSNIEPKAKQSNQAAWRSRGYCKCQGRIEKATVAGGKIKSSEKLPWISKVSRHFATRDRASVMGQANHGTYAAQPSIGTGRTVLTS